VQEELHDITKTEVETGYVTGLRVENPKIQSCIEDWINQLIANRDQDSQVS
jgi:hypothetical protein